MSELVDKGGSDRSFREWIRERSLAGNTLFQDGIDFLKKGVRRRKTTIRLKELKEERLKKVPNYIVLESARKHVRIGIEAVLVLSVLANFVFASQLISLSNLLSQKRIALVPSRLDQVTEVDVGRISEKQVHETFVMYLSLLGNVDATNIDENYRVLKSFMTSDLGVQFERESKPYRQMVKGEALSEQMFVNSKRVAIGKDGQIRAEALVRVRPSIGTTVGKVREEKIVMQMRVVTSYEKSQWLLQLTAFNRTPVESLRERGD